MTDYHTNEADHVEKIRVNENGGFEYREQVVEDPIAAYRATLSKITNFVWLVFGMLESLLFLRLFLKLIAANPANPFANFIYSTSGLFLWPFTGLTANPAIGGQVLEVNTLIAMIVYTLIGWAVVGLISVVFSPTPHGRVSIYERNRMPQMTQPHKTQPR